MRQKLCVKAKFVATLESKYSVLVFELTEKCDEVFGNNVMCTLLPNWEFNLEIGQEGYLEFEEVEVGDIWIDNKEFEAHRYNYAGRYYKNFVPISHVIDGNRIIELRSPLFVN